jgi:hypothetical protein
MRASLLGVLGAVALVGCMSTGMNLQRVSARAILPTPNPDSVQISDLHRGVTTARWIATTRDGLYDCSIETAERVPICAKREPPR